MVFLRLVRGLGVLGALKRLGSRLLRSGKIPVKNLLLGAFIYLVGGSMAP